MKQEGINYRKIIIPTNYLDNVRTNIEMIPSSIYKQTLGYKQAVLLEKLDVIQKLFPEYFVANQSDLFAETMSAFDDNPAKYEQNMNQMRQMMQQQQQEEQGASMEGAGGEGGATSAPAEGALPPVEGASVPQE